MCMPGMGNWYRDPDFCLKGKDTSSNDEPKLLFSLGSEGDNKQVAPVETEDTQDELSCKRIA